MQHKNHPTARKIHVHVTDELIKVVQCISVPIFKGLFSSKVQSRLQKGIVHGARDTVNIANARHKRASFSAQYIQIHTT